MLNWNKKCRYFNEKYACDTLASEGYESCTECKFASEYSKKILIIKLGAMGDVLRTTCILPALKQKYGEDIMIYWMTNPESVDILKNNYLVDKVFAFNTENILRIQQEKFDLLFALEIDTPSTILANLVKAHEKFGYFFDNGVTSCYNRDAEEYLKTAFLNNIKIKNRKTYQELIAKAAELEPYYKKYKPIFDLNQKNINFQEQFKIKNNLNNEKKIIGINIGSSDRWKAKFWDNEKIKQLIIKLNQENHQIIILAGPNEVEKQEQLIKQMNQQGINLFRNNPKNTVPEFAAVVDLCDLIICGDTLVLHLATALNKPTIALFFITSPYEVEPYDSTTKLISPLFEKYFYSNIYNNELADSIAIEDVLKLVDKLSLEKKV